MDRFLAVSILVAGTLAFSFAQNNVPEVLSAEDDYLLAPATLETKTEFKKDRDVIKKSIPYTTRFENNPEMDWGKEEIRQAGVEGEGQEVYEISYWYDKETGRKLVKNEITRQPQEEIISRGIKKNLKSGDFSRCGQITYYGKMRVWATSYDKYCKGCLGVTYTGLPAGYGTVAVDPKVIPLYSRICIPGYGIAVAGDIGGAIKGNKIDLGFDDVRKGWWSARWTEIYLLP